MGVCGGRGGTEGVGAGVGAAAVGGCWGEHVIVSCCADVGLDGGRAGGGAELECALVAVGVIIISGIVRCDLVAVGDGGRRIRAFFGDHSGLGVLLAFCCCCCCCRYGCLFLLAFHLLRPRGIGAFPDHEVAHLLEDQGRQVRRDDFVHVAVSYHQAVTAREAQLRHGEALLDGHGGRLERAQVEEDHALRHGDELAQELGEDVRRLLARLVEENPEPADGAEVATPKTVRQAHGAVAGLADEGRELEAVGCLGSPLVFLAEAPEYEQTGQDRGEREREPGAVGDFGERGGKIDGVVAGEEEPGHKDDERVEAPDEKGRESDHARVEEGDEDDADAVRVAQRDRVVVDRCHEHRADHHEPVQERHEDLPVEDFGGVHDFDLREVRELHDLRDELGYSLAWKHQVD